MTDAERQDVIAQPEGDAPRQETIYVGARGNDAPLEPGGWRITGTGKVQIHCRCGTEFFASEETGLGNGHVGYCIGCKKKIHASSYWERWTSGKADRPFQWIPGWSKDGVRL